MFSLYETEKNDIVVGQPSGIKRYTIAELKEVYQEKIKFVIAKIFTISNEEIWMALVHSITQKI